MATKFISCPRCDGRSEIIRTIGTSVARERCNVCIETPGTLEIVCKPAAEPTRDNVTLPMKTETPAPDFAGFPSCATVIAHGGAGLSWNGFNLFGDTKSISELRRLIDEAHYKRYFHELLLKERAEMVKVRKLLHPGLPG